jgi:hypothetical protein
MRKEVLDDVCIGPCARDVDVLTLTDRASILRGPKRLLRFARPKLGRRHLGEALNDT